MGGKVNVAMVQHSWITKRTIGFEVGTLLQDGKSADTVKHLRHLEPPHANALLAGAFHSPLWVFLSANLDVIGQQPDANKTQPKVDTPKVSKPDEATLKQIAEKTDQLRKALEGLRSKDFSDDVRIDVEIYLKAAENIVRFEEWYNNNSGKWATSDARTGSGACEDGSKWASIMANHSPGKWVVRAYT